ncbi:MAG TPA: sigma-70 family RNA polymerase sigma factor [Solirubrobacteraceae bacterium]|nr:sigma-70 family RNA polymerase sigma factor [Solirubrobacteraceae bacterium]
MVADVDEIYRLLAPRLRQIVRSHVRTSEPVVEDACQSAWSQLVRYAPHVHEETVLSWLATTATREAFKLSRRDRRELSLDAELERSGELTFPSAAPGPAEIVELRDRLGEVGRLSERQQRLVWMQAAGLTYVEMADRTGDTLRTVERQLLRAKGRLEREAA